MKHILYDMGLYFLIYEDNIYTNPVNIGSDSEQSKQC
jgi:hypothetical protein